MTTIFGLKHPEDDFVVLAADKQTTRVDGQTGMPNGKFLERKLWKDKNGNYCFGHAGKVDNEMVDFVNAMVDEQFDIEKITDRGYFPELRKLNIKRMGRKLPQLNELTGIVLATQFGAPKLFTCFPLGEVGERVWTSLGSGDERIKEYMGALSVLSEAQDYRVSGKLNRQDVIQYVLEGLRRAQSRDVYSYGLDMMVVTQKGIKDHHPDLGDGFQKKLRAIQRQYK